MNDRLAALLGLCLAGLATTAPFLALADDVGKPLPRLEHEADRVVIRLRAGSFESRARSREIDPRVLAAILGEGSGEVFAGGDSRTNAAPGPK